MPGNEQTIFADQWVEACPIAIALLDRDLSVVLVNAAFEALAALPKSALTGRRLAEGLPWATPQVELILRTVHQSQKPMLEIETAAQERDRKLRVSAFPTPSGVGIMVAEAHGETVHSSDREAAFHAIFDHAAIGILVMEWGGNGIWINPAWSRLLGGYSAEELARLGIQGITHPDDFPADLALYQKLMAGEFDHYEIVKRYLRKDGSVMHALLVVSLARNTAGQPQILSSMIHDVTERTRAEREIERLTQSSIRGQEEERRRLALALHDGAGQGLTAVMLQLVALEKAVPDKGFAAKVSEVRALTKAILKDLRGLSHDLRPAVLDRLGVAAALQDLTKSMTTSDLSVELLVDPPSVRLPAEVSITLYRIAQAALANLAQHAKARRATVSLSGDPRSLRLEIADDGVGFDPSASGSGAGIGIIGMRERATWLGGTFKIESAPGQGTKVLVEMPLPEAPQPARG